MNLGQAVAICLYELVRGRTMANPAPAPKVKSARSAEIERLTQALLKVLRESGYVNPRKVAAEEKLRRLVRRLELSANDAEVLLGMMRQVAWKLGVKETGPKSPHKS